MEIINLDTDKKNDYKTAVGLGNFDGFHKGHQKLIFNLVKLAKKKNLKPALLLFTNHTKKIIQENEPDVITPMEEKFEIAKALGIEIIFLLDFTEEIMKLSAKDFVHKILKGKLNAKLVAAGFDYRFGYKAEGNIETLKKCCGIDNLDIYDLKAVSLEGNLVSSSLIRELIKKGDLKLANKLLGREYSLKGTVIHGEKRGTKMGFPTANLEVKSSILIPKTGVYKTQVFLNGNSYKALTNIGYNPTFNGNELRIETHILDFSKDIYGKELKICFQEYIREVIKFESVEQLINQMEKDLNRVKS